MPNSPIPSSGKALVPSTGGDQVLGLRLEFGERNVSVAGGDWKFGGVPSVKKQHWSLRLKSEYRNNKGKVAVGFYDWEMSCDLEASWGVKMWVGAKDLKYGTVWKEGYDGHWSLWNTELDKKFKNEEEREEIRGKLGMCLWKFRGISDSSIDELLDPYLGSITQAVLVVDSKDKNYLFLKIQDTQTMIMLPDNKQVAIAIDGKVEVDEGAMGDLKRVFKSFIGIHSDKVSPHINVMYKPKVEALPNSPKELVHKMAHRIDVLASALEENGFITEAYCLDRASDKIETLCGII